MFADYLDVTAILHAFQRARKKPGVDGHSATTDRPLVRLSPWRPMPRKTSL